MILLLCDLDDTLVATGHLYEKAKDDFCLYLAAKYKHLKSILAIRTQIDDYDARQCKIHGLSASRLTNSMNQVAYDLGGRVLTLEEYAEIKVFGRYPFTQVSPVQPGAQQFLQLFTRNLIDIVLVTAGDPTIQTKRIEDFPYKNLFSGARIVPSKTPEVFREILQDHGCEPQEAWMVGNSYNGDIAPARAVGINAAWLQSYSWAFDNHASPDLTGVLIGSTLDDIREQIAIEEGL
jgi:putative hydrolase of the HAD superfamily